MRKTALLVITLIPAMALATGLSAMSLTNTDSEPRTIQITEDGARSERDVAANETIQFCEKGCFITFPDGTLTAYQGSEKIVIRNGGPALAQ